VIISFNRAFKGKFGDDLSLMRLRVTARCFVTRNGSVYTATLNFLMSSPMVCAIMLQEAKSRVLRRLTRNYVMSERTVEESSKVKMFDKFIDDLRALSKAS
jgi:hypothetical protein